MGRTRTALGLLVVIVGTAWLLGGPDALRSGARVALVAGPYLLMAFALALVVRTALPKGTALGPLLLLLAGGVWALLGQDRLGNAWESRLLPLALIGLGALVALGRSTASEGTDVVIPVRRYRSFLVPRTAKLAASEVGVRRIVVRSFFGPLRVDLSEALFPGESAATELPVLHVDVTVFFGRVELVLRGDCAVALAGGIHTYGTSLVEHVPVFANADAYTQSHLEGRLEADIGRLLEISLVGVGGAVELGPAWRPGAAPPQGA
ncbi:hypothetical protein ACIQAC_12735 [Streptomyces sp. NPDC088387]|uniref:hypothetical protein n=1 Tax=Streptomyces sp. NPDC088387 TaxID=3365859 RepID=UPI00382C7DF6